MEYFNTVLTDEGLCCIFNRAHPQYLIQNYEQVVFASNSKYNLILHF